MNKPKISVITPVYNTADYLVRCLDSLESQTMQDIEFICIDDGSTDDSLSILREYEKRDERFRVITQSNAGYGKTMNHGLQEARGEYIGILESDDYAKPNTFEQLYNAAKDNNADVCKANYHSFQSGEAPTIIENIPAKYYETIIDPSENDNLELLQITPSIWSAIYNRDFLLTHNIWFNESPGAAFQDTGFALKTLLASSRIFFLKDAFVFYRTNRDDSSSNSLDMTFAVCEEFRHVKDWLTIRGQDDTKTLSFLEVCKLKSYLWNLRRLHPDLRDAFLWRCHREFNEDNRIGIIDKSLYSKNRLWHLNQILNKPEEYLEYMQDNYKQADSTNELAIRPSTVHELINHYGQAEKELVKQAEAIRQLENETVTANENLSEAHEQIITLEHNKAELENAISALEQQNESSRQDYEKAQQELAKLKKTIESQGNKIAQIKKSHSFRLGYALLAPLRFLRKKFSR